MAIYLGNTLLTGGSSGGGSGIGGAGAPINTYAAFHPRVDGDVITDSSNQIWLRTGSTLTGDGDGDLEDAFNYPDAYQIRNMDQTTGSDRTPGGGATGSVLWHIGNTTTFVAADESDGQAGNTDYTIFNYDNTTPVAQGDVANGHWMPGISDGTTTWSLNVNGPQLWMIPNTGTSLYEVTGTWPNYIQGTQVTTNFAPNGNWDTGSTSRNTPVGWVTDGTNIIVAWRFDLTTNEGVQSFPISGGNGTNIGKLHGEEGRPPITGNNISRYTAIFQLNNTHYWIGYTNDNNTRSTQPTTFAEYAFSDNGFTGNTYQTTGDNPFYQIVNLSGASGGMVVGDLSGRTACVQSNSTVRDFLVTVGDDVAKYTRWASNDGGTLATSGQSQLYIKIGDVTTP